MKKMIVTDYDQTFYINDDDIELNKKYVNKFRNLGNIFVIATGRSYTDFNTKLLKYKFNYDYVILNHGATIMDANDNILLNISISNEIISKIKKDLQLEKSLNYFCCQKIKNYTNFECNNLTKINVKYNSKEEALKISQLLNKKYNKYVNAYYVSFNSVEITASETDKSYAICRIMNKLNINKDNIFTIGDGYSDIKMIKEFNGYCMKKSVKELKEVAKEEVASVSTLLKKVLQVEKKKMSNMYNIIKEALSFYEINDENYKLNCLECFEYINQSKELIKEFSDIYDILFIDKTNKIEKLWNIDSVESLFTQRIKLYVTSLLLLSGFEFHKRNMNEHSFNDKQISIHKKRVRECLINDVKIKKYDGIRVSQMLWGAYFINARIIEVGRLQYEFENEHSVKIHIPSDGKLNIKDVLKSIKQSKSYIKKYFEIDDYKYNCNSWLLSKQIHDIVETNSNIYNFFELFDVEEGNDCIKDILNFVYQKKEINNYNELNEETSLQKSIKQYLINGNSIKMGKGILKGGN